MFNNTDDFRQYFGRRETTNTKKISFHTENQQLNYISQQNMTLFRSV